VEAGTTIIALGGTPGKAYQPRGWELWVPLVPLYEAGESAEVADRLRVLVEAHPQYALLFDHLRHAIEMSEEFHGYAQDDSDLDSIRDEPAFKELIGP
jgi:hypothetical protein